MSISTEKPSKKQLTDEKIISLTRDETTDNDYIIEYMDDRPILLYRGQIHQHDPIRHGYGKTIYKDGTYHVGSYKYGKATGIGMLVSLNDVKQEGEFLDGVLSGEGTSKTGSTIYSGTFRRGLPHGHGNITDYNNIMQYEGNFTNGMPDGKGTITYKNGATYTGEILYGLKHGKGTYKDCEGEWYYDQLVEFNSIRCCLSYYLGLLGY